MYLFVIEGYLSYLRSFAQEAFFRALPASGTVLLHTTLSPNSERKKLLERKKYLKAYKGTFGLKYLVQ